VPETQALSQTQIVHEIQIEAPSQQVFSALTADVASWWEHVTYNPKGKPELFIEPAVGGRFFERSGEDARLYAIVTRYEPGKVLVMQGPMGMPGCVFGTLSFTLRSDDGNFTNVLLEHTFMGQVDPETVSMYRDGSGTLLKALKAYVEHGDEVWSAI
jgi:uncharacterized protein YndB with AHSA1/START domain